MSDPEFDQVASILFDGVPSLEKLGCPGTLIPLTKDTRAVLAGEDSNNVIVVATRFGYGRSLVFAHNSYPYIFLDKKDQYQPFVSNCQRWLTRGHQADFLSINDVTSMHDVSSHGKILVWDGHCTKSDAFMNDLVNLPIDLNRCSEFFSLPSATICDAAGHWSVARLPGVGYSWAEANSWWIFPSLGSAIFSGWKWRITMATVRIRLSFAKN